MPNVPSHRAISVAGDPDAKDRSLDKIKSIAVPVVRRSSSASGRSRRVSDVAAERPPVETAPSEASVSAESHHRFGVGERVRMIGGGNRWARAEAICRIVSLLPHDSGPFLYRVQSEAESYQRVVDEADLSSLRP
jgi:hypothetical protein